MPFDEFSLIVEDYIELLKAKKKKQEQDMEEARKKEAEERAMKYEMMKNSNVSNMR
jgi:hypothetical protein